MIRKASIRDIKDLAYIEINSGYKFRLSVDLEKEILRIKLDFFRGCDFFINIDKTAYAQILIKKDVCHLEYISVIKSEHGKSFGKYLLKHIEEISRKKKCKKISLEVNSKNSVAINLYKKFGYSIVKIKERENYGKRVNKYVMEKNLNS